MVHRFRPILAAALAAALLLGCSSTPTDPDEEIPPEVDEVLGRDRPDYEGQGVLERIFSGGGEAEDGADAAALEQAALRLQRLEQRLTRLEQQVAELAATSGSTAQASAAPQPVALDGHRPELGLVLPDTVGEPGNALEGALARIARDYGLPFTGSSALAERLAETGCTDPAAAGCPGELAVYPGVRVLVMLEDARTTGEAAVLRYRLLDTVTGVSRGVRTLRLTTTAGGQMPEAALAAAAEEMVLSALDLAERAPWQTRAFNQRDGQWYLSAGRAAGLAVGDRLAVHAPGRTIATPGGNVAGWVPGERRGVLEVTGFAGEDIAVARLVEGSAPAPNNPILPAQP